jgi:hypothetical protein
MGCVQEAAQSPSAVGDGIHWGEAKVTQSVWDAATLSPDNQGHKQGRRLTLHCTLGAADSTPGVHIPHGALNPTCP